VSGPSRGAVERDARGRRVCERDRHGAAVATLDWAADGRLAGAAVRIPDGAWLRVAPRAAEDPRWGACDVLHHAGAPLTHFAAVEWAAIDAIPPLAEPARLPPGGGTAVLNLIAALAADQGRGPLAYRGPYPTEQLFLALLESFAFEIGGDEASPPIAPLVRVLELFVGGQLLWRPAPHARHFDPAGVYVQARERVEKLAWRGRAYYRGDWQGIARHGAHRVRELDGRVVGSLWALETALEDHVVLTAEGDVLEIREPAGGGEARRPLPPATAGGLVAIVVAGSAAPLAEAIRAVAGELVFEWAPLAGDLAALDRHHARVSTRLLHALAARLGAAGSRAEQVRLGFAALAEAAHALGDGLRARGQARLAAAGAAAQTAALAEGRSTVAAAATAREIGQGVECLLDEAAQLLA
jgi:hypothetical protein